MKVCIYCKNKEPKASFSEGVGEHIIPQFLGKINLSFGNDTVCDQCNNDFSKFENVFKDGELNENLVIEEYSITASEGKNY